MKKTWILIGGIIVLLIAAVVVVNQKKTTNGPGTPSASASKPTADPHAHTTTPAAKIVPAFLTTAPSKGSLGPTLAPEKFTGLTRDA
jgi:hypothetical protein